MIQDIDKKLEQYIKNIEYLEEQKKEFVEQITLVYKEMKSLGFNIKVVKKIIAMRKKDINERIEEEQLIEAYKEALGMAQ